MDESSLAAISFPVSLGVLDLGAVMFEGRNQTTMPLSGVRVLELGHHMAGPLCAMLLAQFGAEVIKVERPGGDPQRHRFRTRGMETGPLYRTLNRGKRVVCLDLHKRDERLVADELIAESHVLVTNLRPGTLVRLGLDPEAVKDRHPGLVYVSLTGAGWQPTYRDLAVDDGMAQALSGLMWATGWPEDGPVYCPIPISAIATGVFGAIAAAASTYLRYRGTKPDPVGISAIDALAFCQEFNFMHAANLGQAPTRNGGQHPTGTPSQVFRTGSGPIAIMAPSNRDFRRLCDALGDSDLASDERYETMVDRLVHRDALIEGLEQHLVLNTAEHWVECLSMAGIACAPVRRLSEIPRDRLAIERRTFSWTQEDDGTKFPVVAIPDGAVHWRRHELPPPCPITSSQAQWNASVLDMPPLSLNLSPQGRPLQGVSVVDLTRYLAGPFAATLLAELGAEVLKYEPPAGDPARDFGPSVMGRSGYFESINRGKRVFQIDLKTTSGVEELRASIASSDLILENYRPGTLKKMGLTMSEIQLQNPRAHMISISGFGQEGSMAQTAAFDMTIQAFCGIMTKTGNVAAEATRLGFSLGDIAAGLFGALSSTVRLVAAARGQPGGQADIAMTDALYAMMDNLFIGQAMGAVDDTPIGSQHPDAVPQGVFPTADGQIYIAAASDFDFVSLWELLDLGRNLAQVDYGTLAKRRRRRADLAFEIAHQTSQHSTDELARLLSSGGIQCSTVLDILDCLGSRYFQDNELIQAHPDGGEIQVVRSPFVTLTNGTNTTLKHNQLPMQKEIWPANAP